MCGNLSNIQQLATALRLAFNIVSSEEDAPFALDGRYYTRTLASLPSPQHACLFENPARLEQEVKTELDEVAQNDDVKRQLIAGPRVDLAEQIEVTRHISHELDDFIRTITNVGGSS